MDVLRAAVWADAEDGLRAKGARPGPISLLGHSMGSGVSLVVAPYIKNVVGVAVEAPAVRTQ